MEQQNVAPVNHGVLSATGNVALGTVGGGIKSMAKTVLWCVGIGAVIGVLAATGVLPFAAVTTGSVAGAFWSTIGNVVLGGTIGGLVGAAASAVVAPIAGLVGAGKGAVRSTNRVSQEKGAAKAIEAQVAVYQAQAQAEAMAASNDNNKYNFPAKGSPMNQAGSTVNAMQADGRVDAMQLQRA